MEVLGSVGNVKPQVRYFLVGYSFYALALLYPLNKIWWLRSHKCLGCTLSPYTPKWPPVHFTQLFRKQIQNGICFTLKTESVPPPPPERWPFYLQNRIHFTFPLKRTTFKTESI